MKHRLYFALIAATLLFACGDAPPSGILDKKRMVSVLINIHIAEAKANNSFLNADTLRIFYQSLEDTIFTRNQIDKKVFEESYQYYLKKPSLMEKIYGQVVDSLSLREAIKNIN